MVHNAKQKFFVVSAFLSTVSVAVMIGAIVAPNWISYTDTTGNPSKFQGLFRYCEFDTCFSNYMGADGKGALGNGCIQNGGQVTDRLNVTAGTLLAAAAITAFIIFLEVLHITRIAKLTQAAHMWMFWGLIVAFVSSLVGISIFGGTVNSWWNCGSDYCQPYKSTRTSCGVGYAYVFNIVGCGLILLCAVSTITFTKFPHIMFPTNDVIFMTVLFEIAAVVMMSIGVASTEWILTVPNYRGLGLFQNCTAWDCAGFNLPATLTTRTDCEITGSSVTARLSAAAALLVVATVITAVLAVLFVLTYLRVSTKIFITNTKKRVTIIFIGLSLLLQVIAIILASNVFDSYFFCGSSICEVYPNFCRRGIGFGLCLASVCLTVCLITLHFFEFNDWCCFQQRFASGRQSFSIRKVLEGTKENAGESSKEPTNATAPTDPHQREEDNVIQLPAGQWEYDSVSGFYWSEELYLFFDPNTQQFYDPNKDEWFIQDRRTAGLQTQRTLSNERHVSPTRRAGGSVEMNSRVISPSNRSLHSNRV